MKLEKPILMGHSMGAAMVTAGWCTSTVAATTYITTSPDGPWRF